jgi:hypothetical protein
MARKNERIGNCDKDLPVVSFAKPDESNKVGLQNEYNATTKRLLK